MEPLRKGGLVARRARPEEMPAILALRAEAFPRQDGRPTTVEPIDGLCQQMVVERDGRLLAAFRVLRLPGAGALAQSYSAGFYDLSPLAALSGGFVELGRLCLARDPAAHEVLRLVWGAMTRIVDGVGAAWMMGCSSFHGADWRRHRAALALLAHAHLGPAGLRPGRKAEETVDFPALTGPMLDRRAALQGLPGVLRTYLAMGGWVSDHAVVDRELDTLHVFTLVPVAAVSPARAASLRSVAWP